MVNLFSPHSYEFIALFCCIVFVAVINGQLCYLSGCRLNNKNGERDYLIIIPFNKPEKAQQIYAVRWQIEMCFKAMKSSGFNLKQTHPDKIERVEKISTISYDCLRLVL